MAKVYSEATGTNKRVAHWLENSQTRHLMQQVSDHVGIPTSSLVVTDKTKLENGGGAWIHPLLVHAFAL